MNIIRKKNEKHLFSEADAGRVFEYGNKIFMKFGGTCSDCHACNAICLEDGKIICFMGAELVQLVDADLVIY